MIDESSIYQTNNLKMFSTLFLVKGILNIFISLFFLIYASLGSLIFNMDEIKNGMDEIPFSPGYIFVIIGSIGFFVSIAFAIATLVASKYLKVPKNYTFIMVIAFLNCLTGVLGILLGVFTIIELNKPHVKQLFGRA